MLYPSDICSHTLVLLFLLPPADAFLLSAASFVNSHLLALTLNLLLILILLCFGKLFWNLAVDFLSFDFRVFFFICFVVFLFFSLFSFRFVFSSLLFFNSFFIIHYSLIWLIMSGFRMLISSCYLSILIVLIIFSFIICFISVVFFIVIIFLSFFGFYFLLILHISFDMSQHATLSFY